MSAVLAPAKCPATVCPSPLKGTTASISRRLRELASERYLRNQT